MDIKKLYDFEYLLEARRPELTESELLDTVSTKDKKSDEVVSVNVTPGVDGIYVKAALKDGEHVNLQNLNPIVAETLALEILGTLRAMGADHLDGIVDDLSASKMLH